VGLWGRVGGGSNPQSDGKNERNQEGSIHSSKGRIEARQGIKWERGRRGRKEKGLQKSR